MKFSLPWKKDAKAQDINLSTEPLLGSDLESEGTPIESSVKEGLPVLHDLPELSVDAAASLNNNFSVPETGTAPEQVVAKTQGKKLNLKRIFSRSGQASKLSSNKDNSIRVIIGYFPDITEKDAREYALGLAQKHCDQLAISYYGAYKHARGYVFEIQEGGNGKAYSPEIIKYFDSLPAYEAGEHNAVVLKTATRLVEVVRHKDGLGMVILPEQSQRETSTWLSPHKTLKPVIPSREKYFYISCAVFATGFMAALISGSLFRLQPFSTTADVKKEMLSVNKLPRSQWSVLSATPKGFYVKTIRFQDGKWLPPELAAEEPAAPVAQSPASTEGKK